MDDALDSFVDAALLDLAHAPVEPLIVESSQHDPWEVDDKDDWGGANEDSDNDNADFETSAPSRNEPTDMSGQDLRVSSHPQRASPSSTGADAAFGENARGSNQSFDSPPSTRDTASPVRGARLGGAHYSPPLQEAAAEEPEATPPGAAAAAALQQQQQQKEPVANQQTKVDLSTIEHMLDEIKAGWGKRFAPAFGVVGLEDTLDLADVSPDEMVALVSELQKRGARLRHLRLIKTAVLGQGATPRPNPPNPATAVGADGVPRQLLSSSSSSSSSSPSLLKKEKGRAAANNQEQSKAEGEKEEEETPLSPSPVPPASSSSPTLFAAPEHELMVEEGNSSALVHLYGQLGGVNWIQRKGWRGERPPPGKMLKGSGMADPIALHGVTFGKALGPRGEELQQYFSSAQPGTGGESGGGGEVGGEAKGGEGEGKKGEGKETEGGGGDNNNAAAADGKDDAADRMKEGEEGGEDEGGAVSGKEAVLRRRGLAVAAEEKARHEAKASKRRFKLLQVKELVLKFNGLAGKLFTDEEEEDDDVNDHDGHDGLHGDGHDASTSPPQAGINVIANNAKKSQRRCDQLKMLNLPSLKLLDLSGNSLSGPLPGPGLAQLVRLEVLNLSQNRLEGGLPRAFPSPEAAAAAAAAAAAVGSADQASSHLLFAAHEGGSLASLTRLTSLSLRQNTLTGPLGGGRLPPSLTHLNLSANRLTGKLPREFLHMDGLRIMVLDDNKLSGTVHRLPPNIEVCTLRRNKLEGDLSSLHVSGLRFLRKLFLDDNNYSIDTQYATEDRLNQEAAYGSPALGKTPKKNSYVATQLASAAKGPGHATARVMVEIMGQLEAADNKNNNTTPSLSSQARSTAAAGASSSPSMMATSPVVSPSATATTTANANALGAHPQSGWMGGCPSDVEITVVTPSSSQAWRQRNSGALERAEALGIKTRLEVRQDAINPANKGGPYHVVWLEGLKEFRKTSDIPQDRFRPRPSVPYKKP